MFLRAGALSLGLLIASRLLGLLRESAQAAAFGATGLGDVAVLMLALPDWIAGVLASGALAYVLLPAWAREGGAVGAMQRRVAIALLALGGVLAVGLVFARAPVLDALVPGLGAQLRGVGTTAMVFSALAIPMALTAALWATRLQHERDFVGMYAANLVVNAVVIGALLFVAPRQSLFGLGIGLLVAMDARLAWLWWRMQGPRALGSAARTTIPRKREAVAIDEGASAVAPVRLPHAKVWAWAILAAGLPLALPFAARSMASQAGEGTLATFNYAWKLVELPLMLAIQLVATLAFPAIARAVAANAPSTAIRNGFALAWTLACACAAGLLVASDAVAQLLFGWGRMGPEALAHVAQWGRTGAWGLLPQACVAVGVTVLAAHARMAPAVLAYAAALAVLLSSGLRDGDALMALMNLVLTGVAVVVVWALGCERDLPWRTFATAGAALLVCDAVAGWLPALPLAGEFAMATFAALAVIGLTALASPELRAALRR